MTRSPSVQAARVFVLRKSLLAALDRVSRVIPRRPVKPVLEGVRIVCRDGQLRLSGSDGDMAITAVVPCEGDQLHAFVRLADLLPRIRASSADECSLMTKAKPGRLIVNGGSVEHVVTMLDPKGFPEIHDQPRGPQLQVPREPFAAGLKMALKAVSREPSRYVIDALRLERDTQGTRLVATDGRRLVVYELWETEGDWTGHVLIGQKMATALDRLARTTRGDGLTISVFEEPKVPGQKCPSDVRVFVAGGDWVLSSLAVEGRFPSYREIIPIEGQQFVVNRQSLRDTLAEVTAGCGDEHKAVSLDFASEAIRLHVAQEGGGRTEALVEARAVRRSGSPLRIGMNRHYLDDALSALTGKEIELLVSVRLPKTPGDPPVFGPVVFRDEPNGAATWVVMPVSV